MHFFGVLLKLNIRNVFQFKVQVKLAWLVGVSYWKKRLRYFSFCASTCTLLENSLTGGILFLSHIKISASVVIIDIRRSCKFQLCRSLSNKLVLSYYLLLGQQVALRNDFWKEDSTLQKRMCYFDTSSCIPRMKISTAILKNHLCPHPPV